MKILPKINLKLNWKKINRVFNFVINEEQNVPEEVAEYLLKVYGVEKFETLQAIILKQPEIQTVDSIPIVKNSKNGLDELIN